MNTLKLDITELEIDDQLRELAKREYERYFEYNETFKTLIELPVNSDYRTITFAEVTSPLALVVVSDNLVNVKVNDFEITNTKMVLLNTAIETLEIANVDLKTAVVTVYIWGKQ